MWIVTAWQHISPDVNVKGFKKYCTSSAVGEAGYVLWKAVKRKGMLQWVWGRWRHWLLRWRQWHWLIKEDRIWCVLCIKYMKLSHIFSRLFLGGHLWLDSSCNGCKYSILNMCRFYYVKFIVKWKNINSAFTSVFSVDDDTWQIVNCLVKCIWCHGINITETVSNFVVTKLHVIGGGVVDQYWKELISKLNCITVLNTQVLQFFQPMNVGSGNRALKQSLETIRLNIHWVQENQDVINNWLYDYLGR